MTDSSDDDSMSEVSSLDFSFNLTEDANNSNVQDDLRSHFSLGLGSLWYSTWNVDGLTLAKFDQIRLCMLDRENRPQVDVLSINETALKPTKSDSLYSVPGYVIHDRDRKGKKKKEGVMVYVNQDLKHKRRTT